MENISLKPKYLPPQLRANQNSTENVFRQSTARISSVTTPHLQNATSQHGNLSNLLGNRTTINMWQRRIGGYIKKAEASDLLEIAQSYFTVNGEDVFLNDRHWAQILNRLAEMNAPNRLVLQIVEEMRNKLEHCTLGGVSQIIQSLGALKIKDEKTQNSMYFFVDQCLEKSGKSIKQTELFMLLRGMFQVIDGDNLRKLIFQLEPFLFNTDKTKTLLFKQMRINTVVALAACYSKAKFNHSFTYSILCQEIKSREQELSLNEVLYLLNTCKLRDFPEFKNFVEKWDNYLANKVLTQKELILSWLGFTKAGYMPSSIQSRVEAMLESTSTPLREKVNILYGYAWIAETSKKDHFKKLLKQFEVTTLIEEIHIADKIRLLYMGSFFLTDQDPEIAYLKEILDNLKNCPLKSKEQHFVHQSAISLGLKTPFDKPTWTFTKRTSSSINFILENWLKKHPLFSPLKTEQILIQDCRFSLLIQDFEKLGWNQRPIAIQFNGKEQHRLDYPEKIMGKNVCRNKLFEQIRYEIWEFDSREGENNVFDQVCNKFGELIKKHEALTIGEEDSLNCTELFYNAVTPSVSNAGTNQPYSARQLQ